MLTTPRTLPATIRAVNRERAVHRVFVAAPWRIAGFLDWLTGEPMDSSRIRPDQSLKSVGGRQYVVLSPRPVADPTASAAAMRVAARQLGRGFAFDRYPLTPMYCSKSVTAAANVARTIDVA